MNFHCYTDELYFPVKANDPSRIIQILKPAGLLGGPCSGVLVIVLAEHENQFD